MMNLPESLLQEFGAFVEARIGANAPQERRAELLRCVAALTHGLDPVQAEARLRSLMAEPPTPAAIGMLASHFAVGETYFFREPAVFHALEHEILPPLIAARRLADKRLRIWSAGCCSGEEAYTLAILLHRLIPDLADWDIKLLATDINPAFLERARHGAYRDWSFRNVPEWIRQRYFTLNDQGCYVLHREIARHVTFAHVNLMDDTFPAADNGTDAVDILLCRNVLMYFSPARAREVIGRLRRSLAGDGWLVVSQAEAGRDMFSDFSAVAFPEAVFYRKDDSVLPPAAAALSAGMAADLPLPDCITMIDAAIAQSQTLSAAAETLTEESRELACLAKSCADRGLLAAADRWCEAAIAADKCNAGLRYLRATVLEQQGRLEPAVASLRQAIYLDRDFVLAHFALANLFRRQGCMDEARRHMANAAALLNAYAPDDALPESEDITAGWLSALLMQATRHWHDDTQKSQN
jgi:chemotaxis protein methyltransferase CheR